MKVLLTNESYRASTNVKRPLPAEITEINVLRGSTGSLQILLETNKKAHVTIARELSIPASLKESTYRVAVESDQLKTTLQLVDFQEDEQGVFYADKLLSAEQKTYPNDRFIPIWLDIYAPINQQVDHYQLTIKVYQSYAMQPEQEVAAKTFTMEVLPLALSEKDKVFRTDTWQQPANLARQFKVPLWSDAHFTLIDEMAEKLTDLNQQAITIIASECPWRGWFSYIVKDYPATLYEYNMVRICKQKDETWQYDFTVMQRYIDIFKQHGIQAEIDVFGLLGIWEPPFFPVTNISDYPENIAVRYYDESSATYQYITTGADIRAYIQAIVTYFKETNQIGQVRIMADEPKPNEKAMQSFVQSAGELLKIEPQLRLKVAFDKEIALHKLHHLVTDPVTSFYCTCQHGESTDIKGKLHSFYVCNYPDRPNTFLASDLLEARLIGYYAFLLGTNGFTRWALNCWPDNAKDDIRYNTINLTTGDLCLIYPGDDGHLLKSLRYKALERGIEDFHLLYKAAQLDKEFVNKALDQVLHQKAPEHLMLDSHKSAPDLYELEYDKYEQLRKKLVYFITKT